VGARECLSAWLADAGDALDGFPVKALLEVQLTALGKDSASARRSSELASRVAAHWASGLAADITSCSQGTTDALVAWRHRLVRAHAALVQLQAVLGELELLRRCAAEPTVPHLQDRRLERSQRVVVHASRIQQAVALEQAGA
jgi:hypothetical protein